DSAVQLRLTAPRAWPERPVIGDDLSMRRRATAPGMLALALGCTLAVAGCDGAAGVPDREPDVTGVIELSGTSSAPTLAEPSDLYFDQMSLLRGDPVLVDHAGAEVHYGDLAD